MSEAKHIPHLRQPYPSGQVPRIYGIPSLPALLQFSRNYGPFFEIVHGKGRFFVATDLNTVQETDDDRRFRPLQDRPRFPQQGLTVNGLVETLLQTPSEQAPFHLRLPYFSQDQMGPYLPSIHRTCCHFLASWMMRRDQQVSLHAEFMRLSLETLGDLTFEASFGLLGSLSAHPFADHLLRFLRAAYQNTRNPNGPSIFDPQTGVTLQDSLRDLWHMADVLIAERRMRRDQPAISWNLFEHVLAGCSPASDGGAQAHQMRRQMVSFLISGMETTGHLLSWASYFLAHSPDIQALCRAESAETLGDAAAAPRLADLQKLRLIQQVLRETLRLRPWSLGPLLTAVEDTEIAHRWSIKKGQNVFSFTPALHRDPAVWGENPEQFEPQRMSAERMSRMPPGAYRPFGRGVETALGENFATIQATLALGMVLQHVEFCPPPVSGLGRRETSRPLESQDLSVTLRPVDTPTGRAKPMEISPQPSAASVDTSGSHHMEPPAGELPSGESLSRNTHWTTEIAGHLPHQTPLTIFYGASRSRSEDLAMKLHVQLKHLGFWVSRAPLEEAVENLPNTGVVVLILEASHGRPSPQALQFAAWVRRNPLQLPGIHFSVFNCHQGQAHPFQEFSKTLIGDLCEKGGIYVSPPEDATFEHHEPGAWERWNRKFLDDLIEIFKIPMESLAEVNRTPRRFSVTFSNPLEANPLYARYQAQPLKVVQNCELLSSSGGLGPKPLARHLEVLLPEGYGYKVGDEVGIFYRNSAYRVYSLTQRLRLNIDLLVRMESLHENRQSFLPLGHPISVRTLLSEYVELDEVMTQEDLEKMAPFASAPHERDALRALSRRSMDGLRLYEREIRGSRRTILDVLLLYPSVSLPFDVLLEILPPMRPCFYPISSSPLANPGRLDFCVDPLHGEQRLDYRTGHDESSLFLASRTIGDHVFGFVHSQPNTTQPPDNFEVPLILIGVRAGLASFRGILAHRKAQMMQKDLESSISNRPMGTTLLFTGGCQNKDLFFYEKDFESFEYARILRIFKDFSHTSEHQERWAAEILRQQKHLVFDLISKGAFVYVHGDTPTLEHAVRQTLIDIYQEAQDCDDLVAQGWLRDLEASGRYQFEHCR